MARVPQVGLQTGQSAAFQAQDVTPYQDSSGRQMQQLASAAGTVGANLYKRSEELRIKNDTARASEYDQLFAEFTRQTLSPNGGFRALQGKDAGEAYDGTIRMLQAKQEELSGGLGSADQKTVFNRAASARMTQAFGVLDAHTVEQTNIDLGAQQSAAIKGHQSDYLSSLDNPAAMMTAMVSMKKVVNDQADLLSVRPEVRKQMQTDAAAKLHAAAVDVLLAEKNTGAAEAYLDVNKEQMDPQTRAKYAGQVKALKRNQKMSDLADMIVAMAPEGTLAERRAYAIESMQATIRDKKMSAEDAALLGQHLDQQYRQAVEQKSLNDTQLIEKAKRELSEFGTNALTSDLPSYRDLVSSGLVAQFDALRKKTGTESRVLARLMFDLSKGETISVGGVDYIPSTITPMQIKSLINTYGGTTQALEQTYLAIAYDQNPELKNLQKDEAKRAESLRLQKVKKAANLLLTDDERTALGKTGSRDQTDDTRTAKENAIHRRDQLINHLLTRVPLNQDINKDNAASLYDIAIDNAVLDMPARYSDGGLLGFEFYTPQLQSDFAPRERRYFRVDGDSNPETDPEYVGSFEPGEMKRAGDELESMWKRSLLPQRQGEADADYLGRLNDLIKKNQIMTPRFSDRDRVELLEQERVAAEQAYADEILHEK